MIDLAVLNSRSDARHMSDFRQKESVVRGYVAFVCLLAFIAISLTTDVNAGIRGPGKYSGVVIFDRWGGCILFGGVYLMYISEGVKDQLRPYEGQAIELDALDVVQPTNPGDGLIRKLKILGPAPPSSRPFAYDNIYLNAQPIAREGSRAAIELTITNDGDTAARINGLEIGFVLLSERIAGASTPSDGPSMAVITRTNLFVGKGTYELGTSDKIYSYSYRIVDSLRFPESFELAPHGSLSRRIHFDLPAGHYQFFAGYGGGVHESRLNVSNPVSIDLR